MQPANPSATPYLTGRRPGRPGVQLEDVLGVADALVAEGLKPTIERVRQRLGGGSPNTVSAMLDEWFARLPARLVGAVPQGQPREDDLPLSIVQAAQQFWDVARSEAARMQVQRSEATRRELELEREALTRQGAELHQRESSFEQTRGKLDEALMASRQAVEAMQAQMQAQQQESGRVLSEAEAELRRLRKALEEALAGKEALREKSAMELQARQRAADEAEERHLAQERRLLSEIDRERMATRQAKADLAKEQIARAADLEAARGAREAAAQALRDEEASRRDAAATWARQHLETQLELATQRERAAGAEQRASDLASQLQRHQEQSDREITQLRESHAATVAALVQREAHREEVAIPQAERRAKSSRRK